MPAHAQSPFPDPERVASDVRGRVTSSAVFNTVIAFLEGLCCSPSGRRLAGGVQEVATSAPSIVGGAARSDVQKAIERVLAHARQTDDQWNSVVAYGYGSAAALFSVPVAGPLTAVSYGIHTAAEDIAIVAFIHLFRLDHRCRPPERAARYAAGFPGFPVTSIVVEEVSADDFHWDVHFPDKDRC